ncbi:MAG: GNAT family N-acetyltransferase [Phycisphaeraceae bacterium]|nr:GNAT family N-acetyltransferase [Phycisphaeraceae bacterium]
MLAELFLDARRAAFHWFDPESFQLADFASQTIDERIWVAEDEHGRLVGFLSLYEPESFVHHLFVAPDIQRRGIGRKLLEVANRSARRPMSLKVLEQNVDARMFYTSLGWTTTGHGADELGPYLVFTQPQSDSK